MNIIYYLGLKVRHLQVFMLFFCLCANYLMRVNLSIGIVLMTDLNTTLSDKVFDWTVAEQSATQSAFFAGYFFSNLAAAVLVTKFNNKYLLLSSVSITSLATLIIPTSVTAGGYYALLAMRFILGLMQGCMMACTMGLMSRWVPQSERGRCGALVLGGIHLGNLISFSVSGWIGSNYGWPSTFYFSGIIGAIWSMLWAFVGAESTGACTFISAEEKIFIDKNLAETSTLAKNIPIPIKEILLNKACWAIIIATIGHNFGFWILLSEIPTFFKAVLHLSATVNGILTAVPFACMLIILLPASYTSDFLVKRNILSISACRKTFNSIGHIGGAISLVIIGLTTNKELLISMYIIGVTLLSAAYIGHNINHLDILPNFAGFLMGVANGLANISAVSGPLFAGAIVQDAANINQWRIVFLVSAAVFLAGALIFIFLGSGEELEFNKIPEGYEEKTSSNLTADSYETRVTEKITDKNTI